MAQWKRSSLWGAWNGAVFRLPPCLAPLAGCSGLARAKLGESVDMQELRHQLLIIGSRLSRLDRADACAGSGLTPSRLKAIRAVPRATAPASGFGMLRPCQMIGGAQWQLQLHLVDRRPPGVLPFWWWEQPSPVSAPCWSARAGQPSDLFCARRWGTAAAGNIREAPGIHPRPG